MDGSLRRTAAVKKRARPKLSGSDLVLIGLICAVVASVLVPALFRGRPAQPVREREARGGAAVSLGPNGPPAGRSGEYADLEQVGDEYDADEGALQGPVFFSDPYAQRRFTPVDDPRFAAALDPEVERALRVGRIPSLTIALVSGDRIVWTRAAGLANIRVKTAAACDTVYVIGSTFKTMSTMALLQQLDKGRFKLDDPVNNYLDGFKVAGENRRFPVTFRHLLTHTSGLPTEFGRYPVWSTDGPPSLEEYLTKALRLERRPGQRVVYSNIAYTLVAYLVQKFSGLPFKDYMKRYVFDPVELGDTAFEPRPDMAERLAIPYMPVRRRGVFRPVDWAKADVWPAGVVYGTSIDMARWMICVLNRGVYKGRRLLSEAAFDEMMRKQYERFSGPINGGWLNETSGYGLTWWVSKKNGETIIAHSGSISGYTAFIAGNLDRRSGVVILTNGNKAHRHLYDLALKALAAF